MGQEAVNSIVQSLLASKKLHEERRSNIANEAARSAELDETSKYHKEQSRQFDVAQSLAKAMHQTAQLGQLQDIATKYSSGMPIPGATEVNSQVNESPTSTMLKPDFDITKTMQLPINDMDTGKPIQFTTPSPDTFAKQQAARALAIKLPEMQLAHQNRIDEIDEETGKLLAGKEADDQRAIKLANLQADREAANIKLRDIGENSRNEATNKARIAAAQIAAASREPELKNFNVDPYMRGLENGTYTVDEVRKALPDRRLSEPVINSFIQSGLVPFTQKQKDLTAQMAPAISTLESFDKFLGNQTNTTSRTAGVLGGLSNALDQDMASAKTEIEGNASILAQTLSKDTKRISNQEAMRQIDKYVPSNFKPKSYNIKRRNDLLKDLNTSIDSQLTGLAPSQILKVKDNLGISKIPYLDETTGLPVGAAPSSGPRKRSDADIEKDLMNMGVGLHK